MSLLFNMLLKRLVIAFLPRNKHLLISWLQSPSAVSLEPKKYSLSLFPLFPHLFQPVHPKGNQSRIFIGRTDDEAKAPIHWPPDEKNWLIGKDPDAGKEWRQEEKGTTEGEMVGEPSLTWWTWVWASSESWWWTGKPCVLQSMGSRRVRHDCATELIYV